MDIFLYFRYILVHGTVSQKNARARLGPSHESEALRKGCTFDEEKLSKLTRRDKFETACSRVECKRFVFFVWSEASQQLIVPFPTDFR